MKKLIVLVILTIVPVNCGWLQADPFSNIADINKNGSVDSNDLTIFVAAWLSDDSPTPNWNSACDISDPNDGFIDGLDFAVLFANWLRLAPEPQAAAGDPIVPSAGRSSSNWLDASSAWNSFNPAALDENNQFEPTDQLTGNWLSEGEDPTNHPVNEQWILVDLGAAYDLDKLNVWNYYEDTAWAGGLDTSTRGMQSYSLWVAGAGATLPAQNSELLIPFTTGNGWTEVIASGTLAKAPIGAVYDEEQQKWVKGPPIDPTDVILDTIGLLDIQYIGFDIHTSHGANYGGFGHLQVIQGDRNKASNPDPFDGEDMVLLDKVLSWDPPLTFTPTGYDVYIDVDEAKVIAGTGCAYTSLNQAGTSFDPIPNLPYCTTYYWRVDSLGDPNGTPGIIWEFTSFPPPPCPCDINNDKIINYDDLALFGLQ